MVLMTTIALLTDFGTRDGYVGALKGVLRASCPEAILVDISHEIAPQDVRGAGAALVRSYRYFPPATIFLVVVDPGVGTQRRALALATSAHRFVAADNGVLSEILRIESDWEAVELTERKYWREPLSATFHGRDIFAPIAAHWGAGAQLRDFGPLLDDPLLLPARECVWDEIGRCLRGEVSSIDRFGNLITNIGPLRRESDLLLWQDERGDWQRFSAKDARVQIGDRALTGVLRTYGARPRGQLLALVDSNAYLEIALREGDAAAELGLSRGAAVILEGWVG